MGWALLLAPLLLLIALAGYTIWDAANTSQRSVERVTTSRSPISADALAAKARAILLTEHLRIAASGMEIGVVGASREMMETLYWDVFLSLGIVPVHGAGAPDGRLVVELRGEGAPVWDRTQGRITLPSLARLSITSQISAQTLLRQAWLLALIDQATREASEAEQIPAGWQPLLGGLRLWLLRDSGSPLAEGWGEVVAQLYGEAGGHLSAAAVGEICRKFALWDLAPIDFSIPLGCGMDLSIAPHFRAEAIQLSTFRLPENLESSDSQDYTVNWPATTVRRVALALLIEYAVERHGRETIPALLALLKEHNHWDTLIPAVFDVSAAEFEAGWQEWVAEKYGP